MTILRNLVGKLKSKNHKFLDIIKYVSGLYKNKLGKLNYSLLEDIFGLPSSSTAAAFVNAQGKIQPGMNWAVIDKAIKEYNEGPVTECSDECRTLRYLEPTRDSNGQLQLVACSWSHDVDLWPTVIPIPRQYISLGDQDDFSARKRAISSIITNKTFASGTNISFISFTSFGFTFSSLCMTHTF